MTQNSMGGPLCHGRFWPAMLVGLVFCAGWLAAATAATAADPAARKQADTVFSDSGAAFKPADGDQAAVLALIKNNMETGFERRDLSLIEAVLAQDFEFRFMNKKDAVLVDQRAGYLQAREKWEKSETPVRDLIFVVHGITATKPGSELTVTGLSTYRSKYYSPRFIETLVFGKQDSKWLLKRQVLIPVHPNKPELQEAAIFVTKKFSPSKKFMPAYQEAMRRLGPSGAIESLLADAKWDINEEQSVIVVFREPPRIGSRVTVEMIFGGDVGWFEFPIEYDVEAVNPYFVVESFAHDEDRQNEIEVKVSVDGAVIAKRMTSQKDNK